MKTLKTTRYLSFIEAPATGKTSVVNVVSRSSGAVLGKIKWYGPWRQYCFFPIHDCLFNKGCLSDINDMIDELMAARRKPATVS